MQRYEMPKGYKVKGWSFLNDEFGLFTENNNYNYSNQGIKTRPLSFLLWAVAYLMDNFTPAMTFERVALILMLSDMKYFEMDVAVKRTGWSRNKCDEAIRGLTKAGYIKREKPLNKKGLYMNRMYEVEYKYYPTHKYSALLKRLEDEFEKIVVEKDVTIGNAQDAPSEIKSSPKY